MANTEIPLCWCLYLSVLVLVLPCKIQNHCVHLYTYTHYFTQEWPWLCQSIFRQFSSVFMFFFACHFCDRHSWLTATWRGTYLFHLILPVHSPIIEGNQGIVVLWPQYHRPVPQCPASKASTIKSLLCSSSCRLLLSVCHLPWHKCFKYICGGSKLEQGSSNIISCVTRYFN